MARTSNLISSRNLPQTLTAPISSTPATLAEAASDPESLSTYIEGFLLDRRARRHSPGTIATYADRLPRLVWFLEHDGLPTNLLHITPGHLRAFLIYISEEVGRWGSTRTCTKRPLSPSSIHAYARALRTFFRWVTIEANLARNPWDAVQMPKQPSQWHVEAYTAEEIAILFAACESSGHPFLITRNRAILAVLLDSGLRASELLGLRITDVDLSDGTFTVLGKGAKTRTVVIGHFARRELWSYMKRRAQSGSQEQALFLAQGGNAMSYNALRLTFQHLRVTSGITRVHVRAHVCRHTAATQMYRNGIRGATLQEILGHSSFDTTRRWYLNVSREDLVHEHAAAGPLDHMTQALNERKGRPLHPGSLPEAAQLQREVKASSYRAVARRYGVSDTTIRKRLMAAGLIPGKPG